MLAASNHADLPQTPRSLSKSHDDGDVKYFFQRPEQDLANNIRQNNKWSGDDSIIDQVSIFFLLLRSKFHSKIICKKKLFCFCFNPTLRAKRCGAMRDLSPNGRTISIVEVCSFDRTLLCYYDLTIYFDLIFLKPDFCSNRKVLKFLSIFLLDKITKKIKIIAIKLQKN
jgi:hypothetical protein